MKYVLEEILRERAYLSVSEQRRPAIQVGKCVNYTYCFQFHLSNCFSLKLMFITLPKKYFLQCKTVFKNCYFAKMLEGF